MRLTLRDEIVAHLEMHGPLTTTEIALGVRCRRENVDLILATNTDRFKRVPAPNGCSPHAHYWHLSYLIPAPSRGKNRADLLFEVLKDGGVHSRAEIFERVGFMLTNNAASELRDRGLNVVHRVERRVHTYQLVGALGETAVAEEGPPSSSSVEGSRCPVAVSPSAHDPLEAA